MNWYLDGWKKALVFTGRARRKEYWLFTLISVLVMFAVGALMGDTLGGLYFWVQLIPAIAVGVRRMHDTNHSGWWVVVPFFNFLLAITDGQRGPNQFGPDPKATQGVVPA